MPAVCVELGNGGFLAFAPNQVITISDHAGVDEYIVYSAEGVEIPD